MVTLPDRTACGWGGGRWFVDGGVAELVCTVPRRAEGLSELRAVGWIGAQGVPRCGAHVCAVIGICWGVQISVTMEQC